MKNMRGIEEPKMEQPPMAPFIDVVFQLLVFFMLTIQFTDMTVEKLNLPHSTNPQKTAATPDLLILNVTRNGSILIGGKTFYDGSVVRTTQEEKEAFRRLEKLFVDRFAKHRPDPRRPDGPAQYPMLVRADRSTDFEHLQRVLMMASQYGRVEKVMFATEGEEKAR